MKFGLSAASDKSSGNELATRFVLDAEYILAKLLGYLRIINRKVTVSPVTITSSTIK